MGKVPEINMTDVQTEKAFQQQPTVFLNSKDLLANTKKEATRYYRNVGIGFKTPKEAIEGTYIDKKCPFVGNVSIRGKVFKGIVISTKMNRTIILRRDYLHYIKKYNRFEKRHHNVSAHLSPAFARTKIGDVVTVGQCRPVSKTVRFNVIRIEKKRIVGNVRKTFCMF